MLVLLMSTAWIFGPLTSGAAELRAGAAYQQSTALNAEGRTIETQRTRSILGVDVGVLDWLAVGLNLPFEWAQNADQGQLFYRRAELADLDFEVRFQIHDTWQLGLSLTVPGHDSDDALAQRYPETADRFPEIGSGGLLSGAFIGLRTVRGQWLNAGRLSLTYSGHEEGVATRFFAHSSLRVFDGWLSIGPVLDVDLRMGDMKSERYRLGVLERVGPTHGWAFELFLHTDVSTDGVAASTGATASLVWRK